MNIVQIGCNRGYDDATNIIISKNVDFLLLIEPLKVHNESLNKCYENIQNKIIENCIIVDIDNSKTSKIYYHKLDGYEYGNAYELASLNKSHSLNIRNYYKEDEIIEEEIESYSINEILEKYNIFEIDLLFIDTEGFDEKIIKSLNFDKFLVKEIYYENLHCNLYDLRFFLENKGYVINPNVLSYGWPDNAKKIEQ